MTDGLGLILIASSCLAEAGDWFPRLALLFTVCWEWSCSFNWPAPYVVLHQYWDRLLSLRKYCTCVYRTCELILLRRWMEFNLIVQGSLPDTHHIPQPVRVVGSFHKHSLCGMWGLSWRPWVIAGGMSVSSVSACSVSQGIQGSVYTEDWKD